MRGLYPQLQPPDGLPSDGFMNQELVRKGLARQIAARYAAQLLQDPELLASAFDDDELTPAERAEAYAELRRLAATLSSQAD